MPPAVIGMLVIYCFKDIDFSRWQAFMPALIAALIVVLLHIWKKNSLISIGAGTVAYMLMIQLLFK
jgi:branched-subunit amino acid transport protein AzlD